MNKKNALITLLIFIIFVFTLFAQNRTLKFDMQHVTVKDFKANGYILAIGGGGEGTIGRLKGSQVIAIDINKRELEEAPDGPLKIIMDARDLHFLDNTFNTVTSFFTLMYINGEDHEKVFSEIFRVLKPAGKFLVWDAIIPKVTDSIKDRVLVPLTIKLPKEEVETGYGAQLPTEDHDFAYYIKLAEKIGFEVVFKESTDRILYMEVTKPNL
jgi:ubiquinone/menaquinone biosynthesis C-methylase UbiE